MDFLRAAIFGNNVLGFVLDWNGFSYSESRLFRGYKEAEFFDEETESDITGSITDIIECKYEEIYRMFAEFKCHEDWEDPSYFCACILQAAPAFFPHGYSPEDFLAYCAVVSGVIVMCYEEEEVNCLAFGEVAANVIGLVLTGHMMTGEFFQRGSWQQLLAIAKTFQSKRRSAVVAEGVVLD